jgi:hypothetical protein
MYTCNKCKVSKLESDFSFRDSSKGVRRKTCKECHRKYLLVHYSSNRGKYIDKAKKHNSKYKKEVREYIYTYLLANPCVDCGENDPIVLEFDHIDPSTKLDSISSMVNRCFSISSISKEINKCEIRCANCHRRRTSVHMGFYKSHIKGV